jgi:membrane protein
MSFGLVMGLGFLMVVSLVLDAAIQFAGHAIFGEKPIVVFALVAQSILALSVAEAPTTSDNTEMTAAIPFPPA